MKIIARLLPLMLLGACSSQSLPPSMYANSMMQRGAYAPVAMRQASGPQAFNQFAAGQVRRQNAGLNQRQFAYGLGLNLQGAQPMVDNGEGFSILSRRPEFVDLRPGFPPVYDQGGTNACVGFSTVGGLGEYYARKLGWNTRFSSRFLWNMGRKMGGYLEQNEGMMISDAQKIMDAYGMLPEAQFPFPVVYPEQNPTLFQQLLTERPSNAQINEAKKFRISQGWKTVPTVSAMRTALADGKPVVFGIAVFSNIAQTGPDGLIPMPTAQDNFEGGHAVVAVGYDNARRVFIIRNSWGANWGENGYGYLPYDFFRSVVNVMPAYAGFTVK